MGTPQPDSAAAFDELVDRFAGRPGVTVAVAFSAPGLRIDNKIFAMRSGDSLVLKLPGETCRQLVEAGRAEYFAMRGRSMKEWVELTPGTDDDHAAWGDLAEQALDFVRP